MKVESVTVNRGGITPLHITKAGAPIKWEAAFRSKNVPESDRLWEQVQKVVDLPSFKRFCLRYGLLMLWPQVRDFIEATQPANLSRAKEFKRLAANRDSRIAVTSIPEEAFAKLWEFCRADFLKLQKEIRDLEKRRRINPDYFPEKLLPGLDNATLGYKLDTTKPPSRTAPFGIVLFLDSLWTACLWELSNSAKAFKVCERPGCGRVFEQRQQQRESARKYCDGCRPRKDSLERAAKKKVYNRLYYLCTKEEYKPLARSIDKEVMEKLGKAKTVEQIEEVRAWIDEQVSEKKKQQCETTGRDKK